MASQTVTIDKTISEIISDGLLDGENITINNGAIVTVDISPTVLIGQITINQGELIFDGENAINPIIFIGERAEEINVNGAGKLKSTLGWWEHPITSNGNANQTWDFSSYFINSEVNADVFSGCWVETGRRINYDNGSGIPPKIGDWLFKYNNSNVQDNSVHGRIVEVSGDGISGYVIVRFLTGTISDNDIIELHTIQNNNGPDHQISWTATANGSDILEADVWQEFGNARQNASNGLSVIGSGIAGFGFEMSHGSNIITFGNGINGFIPPSGARIKVPMVHIGTALLADYNLGNTTWEASAANMYELETINGGDCFLNGISFGSSQFEDNLGGEFQASYCAAHTGFGVYAAIGRTTYDHCIFISDIEGDQRSQSRSMPPIVDMVSGSDLRDCLGLFTNDSAETTQFGGQTSLSINIERCIQISTANAMEWEMVRVNDFTIYDMVVIGTQMVFTTCLGGDIKLLKTQRSILNNSSPTSDQVIMNSSCSNIKLTGWEILNNSAPDDSKLVITDSNNLQIRGFHFINRKYDNEETSNTQTEEFVAIGGLSNDITISRCWLDRGNPNEFALIATGTSKNIIIQNCSAEYTGEAEPDGINTLFRGLHSGSGNLGSTTGVETDYPGTAGAMCGDLFRSNTTGLIYYRCVPGTIEYPINILSGSPTFTKDGDVDINVGDSWEVDMGYYMRGHTGFQGTIASVRNAETTNTVWNWTSYLNVELQYDNGDGYNGIWINVTDTTTMSNIIFNVEGIKFKFRFTAIANQTNIQAFTLRTNTSIQNQIDNYYPIDQITPLFTLTGLKNNTEIRLFEAGTTNEILNSGQENITSGVFNYEYNYFNDINIDISIISLNYINIKLKNITLSNVNQTIPISQIIDRQYLNP